MIEVLIEVGINARGSLCGFDDDETNRTTVDHRVGAQPVPVDRTLIVRDVNAMHLITLRIFVVAIERTPAETGWTYEEIIEGPHINHDTGQPTENSRAAEMYVKKRKTYAYRATTRRPRTR